jgi:formate dehydrogenase iron-sulfur subunit
VPKYSVERGIIRKCDLCSQRLSVNEAPACVQACPNEAIRITIVDQEELSIQFRQRTVEANPFLPAAPDPGVTLPTTRYVSKKPLPFDLIPADVELRLQPAHWPLVWMLTLTQFGAGAFALLPFVPSGARPPLAVGGFIAVFVGLAASALHLGKPMKAWRSFLGLRKSWLSREIVAFGAFSAVAFLTMIAHLLSGPSASLTLLSWITSLMGILGVFCSGMVYHDTRRAFWRGVRSVGKFFGTTAILGLSAAWLAVELRGMPAWWLPAALILAAAVTLAGEHRLLRRAGTDIAGSSFPAYAGLEDWSLARSAVLMRDQFGLVTRNRFFFGIAGGVALPLLSFLSVGDSTLLAAAALLVCTLTELAGRYLFFRAVVPPRMPGAI